MHTPFVLISSVCPAAYTIIGMEIAHHTVVKEWN